MGGAKKDNRIRYRSDLLVKPGLSEIGKEGNAKRDRGRRVGGGWSTVGGRMAEWNEEEWKRRRWQEKEVFKRNETNGTEDCDNRGRVHWQTKREFWNESERQDTLVLELFRRGLVRGFTEKSVRTLSVISEEIKVNKWGFAILE